MRAQGWAAPRRIPIALAVVALVLAALPPSRDPSGLPEVLQAKADKEARRAAENGYAGKPYDKPDEAMAFSILKRSPDRLTPVPYRRYEQAQSHTEQMPEHSTAAESSPSTRGPGITQPWTGIGPGNVGGRTRGLVIDPDNPSLMYAGGVAGGVWRTTNGGGSWQFLDDTMSNLAVASLAMDPADDDVLYAGTGEGFFNADAVRGAGIFKSTNAGSTWTNIGGTGTSVDFRYVNDIVVSPNDSNDVYAATGTGVFRSTNGGTNWTQILVQPSSGGCTDLVVRTDVGSDTLFAACGNFDQGSVLRNTDAGGTGSFSVVLSETGMGRTSLAIAPSNQSVVYALTASTAAGSYRNGLHAVFRSTNGGTSWSARVRNSSTTKLNTLLLTNPVLASFSDCGFTGADQFLNQGWYDQVIAVDPVNSNRVWVGGIDLFRSDDGGANFGMASHWWGDPVGGTTQDDYVHADQHAIVFHPGYDGSSNKTMFVANDGGVFKTTDALATTDASSDAACDPSNGGLTWSSLNNGYGVTQFYDGSVYPAGTTYFGGTQDNGTVRGVSTSNDWTTILGGDGGHVAVDPTNTNTLYAETTGISIQKSIDGGTSFGAATTGISDTGLFISPFELDPGNSQRLWTGGCRLWRTTNGTGSWAQASAALPLSNATCNPNDGDDNQVSAIAIFPTDGNRVLVGTEFGHILRSTSALTASSSTTWSSVRPRTGYVSSVAFDPADNQIAYATYSTFGGQHVWRTTNGGANWVAIDGSGGSALPDIPVHSIVVEAADPERLYVGTDLGVYVSLDSGQTWAVENTSFPNTVTEKLEYLSTGAQRHLFAFTHGRGAFRVQLPEILPDVSIADASITEGSGGGTKTLNFSVTLSEASSASTTVDFSTSSGSATTPADYAAASGTLTFTAGQTSKAIPVTIKSDDLDEPNESFSVVLTNPSGMLIEDGLATGTIFDDDGTPVIDIGDAAMTEGGGGVSGVSLSPASGNTVTVQYQTSSDSAASGSDFPPQAGTLTFTPGQTFQLLPLTSSEDALDEDDETFDVTLFNPSNATLGRSVAKGFIIDNDSPPVVSVSNVAVTEGASGPTTNANFTVSLSAPSGRTLSVDHATSEGTATVGSDFNPRSGTLTFFPGQTSQVVAVGVLDDPSDEVTETFELSIFNPTNVTLGTADGTGTIVDDDEPPTVSANNISVVEGNDGLTTIAGVLVRLSAPAGKPVGVDFTTQDATAVAPADYVAVSGSLAFGPGEDTKTVDVTVRGDRLSEPNQVLRFNLADPANATLGTNGVVRIVDDEPRPTARLVGNVALFERNAGRRAFRFPVSLDRAFEGRVVVRFATRNLTARAGEDYERARGAIRLRPLQRRGIIRVPVLGDRVVEPDERFRVLLTRLVNAELGRRRAVGTIRNDD